MKCASQLNPYRGLGFVRPPLHELTESFFERHLRLEANQALRLAHVRQPPPDGGRLPLRTIFRRPVNAHHAAESGGQFGQAGLGPACDIEDIVGDCRIGRPQVRPRDVGDENKVHRLSAVAEDEAGIAFRQPLHPADHHFGINAERIHPRAIDVEVSNAT